MLSTIQTKKEIPIYDPNLVLYLPLWKHDGTTFISDDAYGHLATVTGTATWGGQGRTYPSGGGTISITDPSILDFALTDSFTLECWVKSTSSANYQQLFSKLDTVNIQLYYYVRIDQTTGNPFFRIGDGTNEPSVTGATNLVDSRFHHLVFIRNTVSDTIKIFVDLIADGSATDTTTATLANNGNFTLGNNVADTRRLIGTYGEARIYNRALTPQEIQNNYLKTKWRYQ